MADSTATPTTATSTATGARARARAEIRAAILETASNHIAVEGASALSLRAVARDLGMVSSALYRYFPSRDELLTALIIDAYDALGAHTEASARATAGRPPVQRWVEAAMAIRAWAVQRPHDYALLYGTPIPGYAAPDDTVSPGTRVSLALVGIVADAARDGSLEASIAEPGGATISEGTTASLRRLLDIIEHAALSEPTMFAVILAWTQLFGLLTFELFGQTRDMVDDDALLFRDAAITMARRIGLAES